MTDEQRICQSCQQSFNIAPEDFAFYEKMAVPAPTWCPDCRFQRRLTFLNEGRVFNKADAQSGQNVFSNFSPSSQIKVYENNYWFSDAWNPMSYGREYDFTRPFFEQFKELFFEVPTQARTATNMENSDYCTIASYLKNCYMVFFADYTQDSAYMVWDARSKNCFDTLQTVSCELCYSSVNLTSCYQTNFSVNCDNCREVTLSKDLIGCSNCFGCVNLRNKQYYIFNQPHTKEEYEAKLKEFGLHSWQNLVKLQQQANDLWLQFPEKYMQGVKNEEVSGEYINNSKNAHHCYRVLDVEDSKFTQNISLKPCRETYDYTAWGNGAELMYEDVLCGEGVYNLKFNHSCWENNRNLQYSAYCHNSSDLFGCVGLGKKQYCIFNKQYTQEEYEALVPRIVAQMTEMPYTDKLGRVYKYGEFFPSELSPFEYNVSAAKEHFPLTKEEAVAKGYDWYDQPTRSAAIQFSTDQLPDSITEVQPDIAGKVIACAHKGECQDECTTAFTVIPQELAFLLEQGLPLPRLCPSCRSQERTKQRRTNHLYRRQCDCQGAQSVVHAHQYTNKVSTHASHAPDQPCPNEFETTFASDGSEIVYCEACYQQEVD